jgi:PAS domain S-box-containing protein
MRVISILRENTSPGDIRGLATWLRMLVCALVLTASTVLFAEPLRVGIELDRAPLTYVDAQGVPSGFAVELMNSIAREMGFEVRYVAKDRTGMFEDFNAGRTDVLAHVVWTRKRAERLSFAVSQLQSRSTVVVRKGDDSIRSVSDLRGRKLAAMLDTRGFEYLHERGIEAEVVPVANAQEALLAVADGRADGSLTATLMAKKTIRESGLALETIPHVDFEDLVYTYHAVFQRYDSARLAMFNEGLARIRANGTYDRIYERWVGPLDPRPLRFKDIEPYLLPGVGLLTVALGLLIWQRRVVLRLAQQAEELRRSEERLMLVLEGGDHALWDRDFTTENVARNERALAILGYSKEHVDSTFESWVNLIHPDDRPGFIAVQGALEKSRDKILSAEYRIKAKDGTWRWMNTRGKVLERRADGSPLRAAGTHTDITERKTAEEERTTLLRKVLEAQKLESLGLLAGGIAHDFNNLLTVILGQSSLARSSLSDADATQESLEQIESAGQRAADLCQQMLAYAGGNPLARQRVDLNTLISGLTPLLRASIVKDAVLKFDLAPLLPAIEADPTQIRQIVMNLVINASEALGPGGGTIRVATALRGPLPEETSHTVHGPDAPIRNPVCLLVSDTGCGMTPEIRSKIFEPFFTTKFTGRGLGLASVLGIARAHHSLFCLLSEPDAGSTFALFFSASAEQATQRTAVETVSAFTRRRGKILLADDEPALISAIAPMIRRQGYEVVTAVDGREAVDKFASTPDSFLAVVLDFTMPKLNGIGALEAIRQVRPGIPALIMSGFGAAEALSRLPAEKRPIFLQKPFTHRDLVGRLTSALSGATSDEKSISGVGD